MICLPSPIVLKYRLMKYRNELLGHPVYKIQKTINPACTLLDSTRQAQSSYDIRLSFFSPILGLLWQQNESYSHWVFLVSNFSFSHVVVRPEQPPCCSLIRLVCLLNLRTLFIPLPQELDHADQMVYSHVTYKHWYSVKKQTNKQK